MLEFHAFGQLRPAASAVIVYGISGVGLGALLVHSVRNAIRLSREEFAPPAPAWPRISPRLEWGRAVVRGTIESRTSDRGEALELLTESGVRVDLDLRRAKLVAAKELDARGRMVSSRRELPEPLEDGDEVCLEGMLDQRKEAQHYRRDAERWVLGPISDGRILVAEEPLPTLRGARPARGARRLAAATALAFAFLQLVVFAPYHLLLTTGSVTIDNVNAVHHSTETTAYERYTPGFGFSHTTAVNNSCTLHLDYVDHQDARHQAVDDIECPPDIDTNRPVDDFDPAVPVLFSTLAPGIHQIGRHATVGVWQLFTALVLVGTLAVLHRRKR